MFSSLVEGAWVRSFPTLLPLLHVVPFWLKDQKQCIPHCLQALNKPWRISYALDLKFTQQKFCLEKFVIRSYYYTRVKNLYNLPASSVNLYWCCILLNRANSLIKHIGVFSKRNIQNDDYILFWFKTFMIFIFQNSSNEAIF